MYFPSGETQAQHDDWRKCCNEHMDQVTQNSEKEESTSAQ